MQKENERRTGRPLFFLAILCVVVLIVFSVGVTGAKYVSESDGYNSATVALFAPSFKSDEIDLSAIKKPGDAVEKDFCVQNFQGDNLTQVTMKYKINLRTTGNLPLNFTLSDGDGTQLDVWSCTGTEGERVYEYASTNQFDTGNKETHAYKLKVDWPEEKKDAQFAELTDALLISVEFEQID